MIIKELKKVSISEIIVLILLIIILLQKCNHGEQITETKITRDTVWIKKDSTIITNPQIVKTIPYEVPVDHWNTEYLPDTSSIAILVKQYEALVRELLAKNVHIDSIKIDSIGHVYITDTVSKNEIISRSTHYNLKYPVITNTITLPAPKVGEFYWGVGVGGRKNDMIDNLKLGFMYKNKHDYIFGPSLFIKQNGELSYGVDMFLKIK